jgi:hypothetical protein
MLRRVALVLHAYMFLYVYFFQVYLLSGVRKITYDGVEIGKQYGKHEGEGKWIVF